MDDKETKQWATILHFSLFSGIIIPLGGLIVPIVIWQLKKADLPGIDPHGKVVVNWIISSSIYFVVSFLLTFVVVGFLLIPIFGIMAIIFPIVGGIQASSGRLWKYPLSIEFIK
jgi:uncharacterized Tic20 family protein